jgi:hypothetical protein
LPPNQPLRLIVDEDLDWKISPELRARGYRDTTSAFECGVANKSVKDPVWLWLIERSGTPSVLVTFDNKMPVVHRAAIIRRGSTLAVVDSKAPRDGLTREEYTRDVVHRWAHRMVAQVQGTRRKYTRTGSSRIDL